ncbi:Inosamine-phosphate amidinotransferase 1 [Diplonema papillatum]|nr:Inosamine-phosphate amidinotransferase 1 [Diplonema papillatum]
MRRAGSGRAIPLACRQHRRASGSPAVNSHTEWDPLEEVIVGSVDGAAVPEWHVSGKAVWPPGQHQFFKDNQGRPFPPDLVARAASELEYLCEVLRGEGITVRRPEAPMGFDKGYETPDFKSKSGLYAAMPRDVLIVFGNEIIEAPMAWRSRFFEYRPYRKLIKEYFSKGAKWTAAPKPLMSDDLYNSAWEKSGSFDSVVTEFEPVFDAAEFVRVGADVFTQLSHVTNQFGIDWLRRHLGPDYTVHVLDFDDRNGMHIDGTFIPIAEGKLLVNPTKPCLTGNVRTTFMHGGRERELRLPECFKDWDVLLAPTPTVPSSVPLYFTSPWTATANVLMLDDKKVIVEANEAEAIARFKEWGFLPIPVPFRSFLPFGGSFHCATCDVRRKGSFRQILPKANAG